MTQPAIRRISTFLLIAGIVTGPMTHVSGQPIEAPLDRGFERSSSISFSVEEMLGSRVGRTDAEAIYGPGHPELWIGEIQYKPVRMMTLNVTDPATGQTSRELVWYMVYRVIARDYTELAGDETEDLRLRLANEATDPQNEIDDIRAVRLITPKFVLQVTDHGSDTRYVDEPNPEIQNAIMRREFRGAAAGLPVFNAIDGITEVPEAVSVDDPDPLANAVYGVAVWRNVDPETDYFNVEMTGFTNAYRISPGPDGPIAEDKCFIQWFGRPGDRFDENEREFRFDDEEHPPTWTYRKRAGSLDIDKSTLSVLRRGSADGVAK